MEPASGDDGGVHPPPAPEQEELRWAIEAARQAVELDAKGEAREARHKFVEAADWLLLVMKRERNANRKAGLYSRIENYLSRAEKLKRIEEEALIKKKINKKKQQAYVVPPGPILNTHLLDSRSRTSTAEHYFTADDLFKSDVSKARSIVNRISSEAKQSKAKFVDPEFAAGHKALVGATEAFVSTKMTSQVKCWLRVRDLDPGLDMFPGDPTPKEVDQGALGNCWLLSSLSVLAAFPELIRRLLVAYDLEIGIIAARLCYAGQWRLVFIDDRLPCRADRLPVFARPQNNAVWCCILEKALAKLHGAYNALDNGTAAEALGLLTGLPTSTLSDIHQNNDLDALFTEMQRAYDTGSIISASCGHTGISETTYEKVGLRHAHEYAVLRLIEAQNIRLVELRNPWARGEFRGRWSRSSKEWASGPGQQLIKELMTNNTSKEDDPLHSLITDDGIFWIQLEDLAHYFHEITVCRLRRNFAQRRLPVCGGKTAPQPSLHGPYRAFLIETAADGFTLDACLVQATERGKLPRGHHVVADAWLSVFRLTQDDKTPEQALANNAVSLVSTSDPGMLAAIVAADEFEAQPHSRYLIVPFFFNWRTLHLDSILTAVLYSSLPLPKLVVVDLDPRSATLALRCLTVSKGKHQGNNTSNGSKKQKHARLYDFHGVHLMENTHTDTACAFSLSLGHCTNLVSSRHGGVLDPNKPTGTYKLIDTLPPRSFQINLIRSPFRASWAIDSTELSWKFGDLTRPVGTHIPSLPSTSFGGNSLSIHTPFPLPPE